MVVAFLCSLLAAPRPSPPGAGRPTRGGSRSLTRTPWPWPLGPAELAYPIPPIRPCRHPRHWTRRPTAALTGPPTTSSRVGRSCIVHKAAAANSIDGLRGLAHTQAAVPAPMRLPLRPVLDGRQRARSPHQRIAHQFSVPAPVPMSVHHPSQSALLAPARRQEGAAAAAAHLSHLPPGFLQLLLPSRTCPQARRSCRWCGWWTTSAALFRWWPTRVPPSTSTPTSTRRATGGAQASTCCFDVGPARAYLTDTFFMQRQHVFAIAMQVWLYGLGRNANTRVQYTPFLPAPPRAGWSRLLTTQLQGRPPPGPTSSRSTTRTCSR